MTTTERPGDMNDEVARLVRLAGPTGLTGPIAAERVARVRTAVYGAWSEEYVARQEKTRRRRLTVAVLFAAAASVVLAVAIWGSIRTPVARVDRVTAQATGSRGPVAAGGAVTSGSMVTTFAGTLAMTLTSGVQLRLDASSTARVDSATDVWLEHGAVYVDSGGAPGASPISIRTTAGVVHDIGTQFDVRLEGDGMRVRVRDGEVRVTYANGAEALVGAGQELFSPRDRPDRSISPRPIAATGSEWAWAERAAPLFSVDGKTLGEFLDWVSREGALTVTFADSRLLAKRARVITARPNALSGLTLAEALADVLPTCGLRHRIDINGGHRVVVIDQEPGKGAIR